MKPGWIEAPLGELCDLVKGTSPTMASEPGPYPLVVTAAFRRSSDSFQFTRPAACIPTISSTGHGNAAIHRIHYQDGRFALANLLVAATPKDETRLNAKYLWRYLSAVKDRKLVPLMQGTANVSLKEADLRGVMIELPPLAEQQRIAARLDAIETRLARVHQLREESHAESLALMRSLINEAHCHDIRLVPMSELVTWRSPDVAVSQSESYTFAGVYSFGRGVFRKESVSGMDFAYDRLTRLRAGEFTYPKLMAWEGALGVVPENCDGCHVSPEFPVFTVHKDKVRPVILDIHFKTPAVWQALAALSPGTNLRRRRLNPNEFLRYQFPLPPMDVQMKVEAIAQRIADKHRVQDLVKDSHTALVPSLLDQIFNG